MSACASGAHAIGEAMRMIRAGDAQAVVAGGAEATLTPLAMAAFATMDATSPTGISRPFDARRDGFVMGEGAGVLVLESEELAKARGARVLGEVLGYGATADAHHLTAPEPTGRPAPRAITRALRDAGVTPEDVDYINAHGTSTPLNDRSETEAIKLALGERAYDVPVSSTKSAIGHLLGAAGAVEAIATVLALPRGWRRRRSTTRSPTRASTSTTCPTDRDRCRQRERPWTRDRALKLVRVRRPQRRSLPGGARVSVAVVSPNTQPETASERQLDALGRLETLCDPGSLELIRTDVLSRRWARRPAPGDGVLGGAGLIDGHPVFCYAQDPTFAGGSLGEQHANTIVRVLELADKARSPVVGFISSGGARMQEGVAALGGYGRIFHRIVKLSGRVPQVSIVTGTSAGGGAYSPALTDWVVMSEQSSMFLTGPGVVREALGEDVTADQLGGTRVHERNGVCHFVAPTDANAAYLARELLGYLPRHRGAAPPAVPAREPLGYDPSEPVPADHRCVYDVRDVIRAVVDGGELLEVAAGWARNLVTGFARIDGRTVGVVANQPHYLGGSSTRMPRRRALASSPSATRSGFRCSCSSTRPATCPGPSRSRLGSSASARTSFARSLPPRCRA